MAWPGAAHSPAEECRLNRSNPRPCPYCGHDDELVTGREVYPHRPDLFAKPLWACMPCRAWSGCHPGTEKRMGRLANAETRQLKMRAHEAFDPRWKSGGMKRKDAYAWLRERTGLDARECHIGWMSDADLRRVIEICEGANA
ncbi:DUF3268 family zinc-finger domain-containing protein [Xanthomonas arboricola]|uniref:DUF3268 family zinc-finger domain-containing protein n=1 Tax=Xanthomonas arboricola TaxID=56448 RepID=UPI002158271D|nr:DUF3268 family zinc-finger domain-containing protein [Xanthomonas arboricola]